MSSLENKADQLIAEAEKKATPFSFFTSFFIKTNRTDHAIECYLRAANLLKVSKNWCKAAICFKKAAELNCENNSRYEAAMNYINAANCFKKCDPQRAVPCLLQAIEILTDMGRFVMAARHHQIIAEIYEVQIMDLAVAIQHYEQAADYFKGEEEHACANKCLLKIAHYSAIFGDYQRAIEVYQQVALSQIGGTLFKYNVQTYLFKAALCHLCADTLSGRTILQRYVELFPIFENSMEYTFLDRLIDCIEADEMNSFNSTILDFESIYRTDDWISTMLSRVKNIVEGADLR